MRISNFDNMQAMETRNINLSESLAQIESLSKTIGRKVKFMEICGTHTMSAFRTGLRSMLPENVSLISGPGCPVCVTPHAYIDFAIEIAKQNKTIVATFGDMIRVPGTDTTLEAVKALGGNVKVTYSPLDALEMAKENPDSKVIFLGVGFETTVPTIAWTIKEALDKGINNYSVLCAHKTMPAAMSALLCDKDIQIDGFLCPGHVSIVIGADAYKFVCEDYKIPCVIAGFEAADIANSIMLLMQQIADGRAEVENEYKRSVDNVGNKKTQAVIADVFEPDDVEWRGLGIIPGSGLKIREKYSSHNAAVIFSDIEVSTEIKNNGCICGEVLKGIKTPLDCPLFEKACSPDNPFGACMVSTEGTCAAYYKYSKRRAS